MVFEVNNTTGEIINELQDAIEIKIGGIASTISKDISELKDSLNSEETTNKLKNDIAREIEDASDTVKKDISKISSTIEELPDDICKQVDLTGIKDKLRDLKEMLNQMEEKRGEIGEQIQNVRQNMLQNEQFNTFVKDEQENGIKIKNKVYENGDSLAKVEENNITIIEMIKDLQKKESDILENVCQLKETLNETKTILLREFSNINNEYTRLKEIEKDNGEKLEGIIDYMKKPGIVRIFKGMKGEKNEI